MQKIYAKYGTIYKTHVVSLIKNMKNSFFIQMSEYRIKQLHVAKFIYETRDTWLTFFSSVVDSLQLQIWFVAFNIVSNFDKKRSYNVNCHEWSIKKNTYIFINQHPEVDFCCILQYISKYIVCISDCLALLNRN